jgi:hypothetical protein
VIKRRIRSVSVPTEGRTRLSDRRRYDAGERRYCCPRHPKGRLFPTTHPKSGNVGKSTGLDAMPVEMTEKQPLNRGRRADSRPARQAKAFRLSTKPNHRR